MPEYEIAGQRVRVADGVSYAGAVDLARQRGVIDQQEALQALGQAEIRPEAGGVLNQALLGAGKAFSDRSFGLFPSDVPAPEGAAATIGGIAPAVLAAFAVPASIPAQAAGAAAFEALSDESSPLSILFAGGGAAAGAAAGKLATKWISGVKNIAAARAMNRPLTTTSKSMLGRQFARSVKGAGAFSGVDDANQRLINRAAAKAILQNADEITPQVLEDGANAIGKLYQQAIPDTITPDMSAARAIVEGIPDSVLPGKAKMLANLASNTGKGLKDADALMRDKAITLARSQAAQWADELYLAREALESAAEKAGADIPLLREAGKRWNVFRSLEEIGGVVKTGNVPAGQLVDKFRRMGKKGLAGFIRGKGSGVDQVDELAAIARTLAADPVPIGSETASRIFMGGPGVVALGGLATGQLDPTEAALLAATGLAPSALGPAAFGQASNLAIRGLAGGGGALAADLRRD